MLNVAICGVNGRMGQALTALCKKDEEINLVGATEIEKHPICNKPLLGFDNVIVTDSLLNSNEFDVAIDFTTVDATLDHVQECVELNKPIVIGTTGFSNEQLEFIKKASKSIPILYAPNMSFGVNLMYKLIKMASEVLKDNKDNWDVAICEKHHKYKIDSPSGTAVEMGKIASKASGKQNDEIQFNSLRLAQNPGEHTIIFALKNENIEISHRAISREIFAEGAIVAAKWINGKKVNLYNMEDVISS